MKTFVFFLVVVLAFVAFLHWREWEESRGAQGDPERRSESASPNPTTNVPARPSPVRAESPRGALPVTPAPESAAEDAREFKVIIDQIVPGQGALAHGGFYRLNSLPPPTYRSPLEERPGQARAGEATRGWTEVGDLFITGIPPGRADGEPFNGWLVRTGAKTFTLEGGKYRTVPAYRVVPKPAGVDATPKPGEWMLRNYRRSLER
jgi:hypothetical protein